jgi:hypothetical protein
VLTDTLDTTAILQMLKGFRTGNVQQFKSSLHEMDKCEYGAYRRQELCSKLATVALTNRDAGILEALLEVHGDRKIDSWFHGLFDFLKHEGKDPGDAELVRIIETSKFKSMVKPGKRFRHHPLDH